MEAVRAREVLARIREAGVALDEPRLAAEEHLRTSRIPRTKSFAYARRGATRPRGQMVRAES